MRRRAAVGAVMLLLCSGTIPADVIHLKDGRSIDVESWRYEGDQLVFEIAAGSVTIPRSLVVKIEPSAPPRKDTATPESGEPSAAAPAPPAAGRGGPPVPRSAAPALPPPARVSDSLSDPQLLDAVDSLKRRLHDDPRGREADSREIARGLSLLAMRLDGKRDRAGAESLFAEALTYDSRCLPALIGLSACYLRDGKDLYARAQIEEALVLYPRDPTLHDLLGTVYYQQENVADAISEWEASLSLKSDPRVSARLEKARRELSVDRDFSRSEAAHFTLRYDGGAPSRDLLGASIRDYLEEKYLDLADKFHFVPPAPFVVILYPTREFHEMTHLPASVVGLFDGKIRIPIGGLKALNPAARAVLTHELTHAFVYGKSGGTCPRWLQEGLAQFMEGRPLLGSEERGLARDLAASEGKSWYESFTYPSSLSFTRYLVERFGFEALVETLERMRGGLSAEEGLKEATREEFSELQKEWMDSLLKKFAGRS